MDTLLLFIFVALFLGGCQLSQSRAAVFTNSAEREARQGS
jgi:hypothetical protein